MNGCIYRTKDNECELWTDDKHKSFCDEDCTDKHPSNADRIRSMTDEELATFLCEYGDCPCVGDKFCERGTRCKDAVLMWLKQECES